MAASGRLTPCKYVKVRICSTRSKFGLLYGTVGPSIHGAMYSLCPLSASLCHVLPVPVDFDFATTTIREFGASHLLILRLSVPRASESGVLMNLIDPQSSLCDVGMRLVDSYTCGYTASRINLDSSLCLRSIYNSIRTFKHRKLEIMNGPPRG